jgi:ribonucleoside-diphosphate reductase beta chain
MSEEKHIINLELVDFTKEPMFFGKSLNLQRYDKVKNPIFYDLYLKQLSFSWRPEEVDIQKDRGDFNTLSEHEKFIFTKNLSYQILLDSIQSRGIKHITENTSNPEIELFGSAWQYFETLHSYSYSYIIKNIYPNPTEVFDNILKDSEIIKRTTSVTSYYDELINSLSDESDYEKRKKLYLTIMSINILEGIRFYVSFACSFAFAENKKMEGNAKIIKLISRDENCHLAGTQKMLMLLRNNESEGFQEVIKDCEPIVIKMFKDAAEEEMEWARYLFEGGSMLGLNAELLNKYMKHLTNRRMKAIGLKPIFENTENPLTWVNNWTGSTNVQEAPQETEKTSYVVGSFKQDLDNTNFSDFKF